eukprot:scaffold164661_cov23-Tisochrysis_lutea.AAC.1
MDKAGIPYLPACAAMFLWMHLSSFLMWLLRQGAVTSASCTLVNVISSCITASCSMCSVYSLCP